MTLREAFMLGFLFHRASSDCWSARDVGRVMTCDFWPEEFHDIAGSIPWTRTKGDGMKAAMEGIFAKLDSTAPTVSG